MPHVQAAPGDIVQLDNGITVDDASSINVDVTLPLAAAALAAGEIIELDSDTAPVYPGGVTGSGVPLGVFSAPVTDGLFSQPPPIGSQAIGQPSAGDYAVYYKVAAATWKSVAIA